MQPALWKRRAGAISNESDPFQANKHGRASDIEGDRGISPVANVDDVKEERTDRTFEILEVECDRLMNLSKAEVVDMWRIEVL